MAAIAFAITRLAIGCHRDLTPDLTIDPTIAARWDRPPRGVARS
jgi:hypothetical protein